MVINAPTESRTTCGRCDAAGRDMQALRHLLFPSDRSLRLLLPIQFYTYRYLDLGPGPGPGAPADGPTVGLVGRFLFLNIPESVPDLSLQLFSLV